VLLSDLLALLIYRYAYKTDRFHTFCQSRYRFGRICILEQPWTRVSTRHSGLRRGQPSGICKRL